MLLPKVHPLDVSHLTVWPPHSSVDSTSHRKMHSAVFVTAAATALVAGCQAAFTGNLNYNSPSPHASHVNMGMNLAQISARSWKRSSRAYEPQELNFTHGVASGDPFEDSVILWTRVAPLMDSDQSNVTVEGDVPLYVHDNERFIQADANPICVEWKVYEGKAGNSTCRQSNDTIGIGLVSSGEAYTTSDIDFTVKVSLIAFPSTKKLIDHGPGRSWWPQALDDLSLPVQHLRF